MLALGITTFTAAGVAFAYRVVMPVIGGFREKKMWHDYDLVRSPDWQWQLLRVIIFFCEALVMWSAMAMTCGSIMYLTIGHWLIDSSNLAENTGVLTDVDMYDLFYASYALALIPLLSAINARPLGIFFPPKQVSTEDSGAAKTFLDLLTGNHDEAALTTFSSRTYLSIAGFLYILQATEGNVDNFHKRFLWAIGAGGVLFTLIVICLNSLLAHVTTLSVRMVTNVFSAVSLIAFSMTIIFLSCKMIALDGSWVRLISGDISTKLSFLIVCAAVPGVVWIVFAMWVIFASNRSYSRV